LQLSLATIIEDHITQIFASLQLFEIFCKYVHNKAMGKKEMACNLTGSYEGNVPIRNMKVAPQ
jgi:hypothetical protein